MPATTRIPGQVLISQVGFEGGKKNNLGMKKALGNLFCGTNFLVVGA